MVEGSVPVPASGTAGTAPNSQSEKLALARALACLIENSDLLGNDIFNNRGKLPDQARRVYTRIQKYIDETSAETKAAKPDWKTYCVMAALNDTKIMLAKDGADKPFLLKPEEKIEVLRYLIGLHKPTNQCASPPISSLAPNRGTVA